jgi:hypothetical protein
LYIYKFHNGNIYILLSLIVTNKDSNNVGCKGDFRASFFFPFLGFQLCPIDTAGLEMDITGEDRLGGFKGFSQGTCDGGISLHSFSLIKGLILWNINSLTNNNSC